MIEKQNTEEFKKKISENVTVAEFYTDWCPTCKTLARLMDRAAEQWAEQDPRVRFLKVNVEEENALMNEYEIRSVPTVMVFRQGAAIERHTGALGTKPLNDMINRALRDEPRRSLESFSGDS